MFRFIFKNYKKISPYLTIILVLLTVILAKSLQINNKKLKIHKAELMTERANAAKTMFELAKISPRTAQLLYQLMKDVDIVMAHHNVEYWADGGTLLGAVRHQGIIPYDDDLDIEINSKDISKLPAILADLRRLGYSIGANETDWIQVHTTDQCSQQAYHMDIFVTKFEGNKGRFYNETAQKLFGHKTFNKNEVYPIKKYKFGEMEISGPNNPYLYLEQYYSKDVLTKGCIYAQHSSDAINVTRCLTLTEDMLKPAAPTGPLLDHSNLLN